MDKTELKKWAEYSKWVEEENRQYAQEFTEAVDKQRIKCKEVNERKMKKYKAEKELYESYNQKPSLIKIFIKKIPPPPFPDLERLPFWHYIPMEKSYEDFMDWQLKQLKSHK